ncbi:hypothetical protein BLNAU_11293 [Blattamonas nauphoetae]|uniref:JAB1/MPN/MOV34 metalloenzyme domain-containing protein n=1 Tax=Blattamonas nauphoetae TaxID=2049346 RepID=A0ABQ9XMW0_9EUKA|nr:hypothetical protein BLNAU_11293 [Blattamonas nauphoetae]
MGSKQIKFISGILFGYSRGNTLEITHSEPVINFDFGSTHQAEDYVKSIVWSQTAIYPDLAPIGWYSVGSVLTTSAFYTFEKFFNINLSRPTVFLSSIINESTKSFPFEAYHLDKGIIDSHFRDHGDLRTSSESITSFLTTLPKFNLTQNPSSHEESVAFSRIVNSSSNPVIGDSVQTISQTLSNVNDLLDTCIQYCDNVTSGAIKAPNQAFGHALFKALAVIDNEDVVQKAVWSDLKTLHTLKYNIQVCMDAADVTMKLMTQPR